MNESIRRMIDRLEGGLPADKQAIIGHIEALTRCLEQFVEDIESTGGVLEASDGLYAPVSDPDWIDLGHTYLGACSLLGRAAMCDDGDIDGDIDAYGERDV